MPMRGARGTRAAGGRPRAGVRARPHDRTIEHSMYDRSHTWLDWLLPRY
jgi:hypothetical protein